MGTVNNVIQVKKTDFEVFDALMVDSQKCSDMSGEWCHAVTLFCPLTMPRVVQCLVTMCDEKPSWQKVCENDHVSFGLYSFP